MRVAQVLRPAAGGMLQHVHVLAGSLAGRGWQVVVGSPEPLCAPGALDVRVPITARPSITSDLRAIRRIG
ncbi:MAG TPA: hypothetical protein VLH79_14555, partial [Chthonomonadales bacterium]|nr:hypothetical protein [Chthonomonadales bacterium]